MGSIRMPFDEFHKESSVRVWSYDALRKYYAMHNCDSKSSDKLFEDITISNFVDFLISKSKICYICNNDEYEIEEKIYVRKPGRYPDYQKDFFVMIKCKGSLGKFDLSMDFDPNYGDMSRRNFDQMISISFTQYGHKDFDPNNDTHIDICKISRQNYTNQAFTSTASPNNSFYETMVDLLMEDTKGRFSIPKYAINDFISGISVIFFGLYNMDNIIEIRNKKREESK